MSGPYRSRHFILLLGQGGRLAIAYASDVTDKTTFLVGDTYFYRGNLMMIADADSFSPKQIAIFGARHKHNAVTDTKGKLTLTVH